MIYLLAILVGFVIIFSMVQNSSLSTKIGVKQTSVVNFFMGLIASVLFFVLLGNVSDFQGLHTMNAFGYMGGVIAIGIVMLSSYVLSNMSVIIGSMLMYTGQMIASFMIDYYRGIRLSPHKLVGILLVIVGIYVNNYIDYKNKEKVDG